MNLKDGLTRKTLNKMSSCTCVCVHSFSDFLTSQRCHTIDYCTCFCSRELNFFRNFSLYNQHRNATVLNETYLQVPRVKYGSLYFMEKFEVQIRRKEHTVE